MHSYTVMNVYSIKCADNGSDVAWIHKRPRSELKFSYDIKIAQRKRKEKEVRGKKRS
jgi:hypothetical protein